MGAKNDQSLFVPIQDLKKVIDSYPSKNWGDGDVAINKWVMAQVKDHIGPKTLYTAMTSPN